jgi:hypothetical protein
VSVTEEPESTRRTAALVAVLRDQETNTLVLCQSRYLRAGSCALSERSRLSKRLTSKSHL